MVELWWSHFFLQKSVFRQKNNEISFFPYIPITADNIHEIFLLKLFSLTVYCERQNNQKWKKNKPNW